MERYPKQGSGADDREVGSLLVERLEGHDRARTCLDLIQDHKGVGVINPDVGRNRKGIHKAARVEAPVKYAGDVLVVIKADVGYFFEACFPKGADEPRLSDLAGTLDE